MLDDSFFASEAFRKLINFRPFIMSEKAIREFREREEQLDLNADETMEACLTHRSLVDAVEAFDSDPTPWRPRDLAYWLASLLYVVRCNLDHGEKTPFGADQAKARRDKDVLEVALPALKAVLLRVLGNPNHRFAVYGTLRCGEPNHDRINDLGEPEIGAVSGTVAAIDGCPVFRWITDQQPIEMELYKSPEKLDDKRWRELDDFEGPSYRQCLVPVRNGRRSHVIATVYADARS